MAAAKPKSFYDATFGDETLVELIATTSCLPLGAVWKFISVQNDSDKYVILSLTGVDEAQLICPAAGTMSAEIPNGFIQVWGKNSAVPTADLALHVNVS